MKKKKKWKGVKRGEWWWRLEKRESEGFNGVEIEIFFLALGGSRTGGGTRGGHGLHW